MSYHQKRKRCSFCRAVGRNVEWDILRGAYMHYECRLTEDHLSLRRAMCGRDYDSNGNTPPPIEAGPDQLKLDV